MNLSNDPKKEKKLPDQAKGNAAYEQTPEDMPLWCCDKNCGRNSRITVFVLSVIGIACSIWLCLSSDYFKFISLRNDTFYDIDKKQPEPFQYATEANVGLYKYVILDVFEYPWPPPRERVLFNDMLEDELRRLQDSAAPSAAASASPSAMASATPTLVASMNPTAAPSQSPSFVPTVTASEGPSLSPSILPSGMPSASAAPSKCIPPLEPGAAVDCVVGSESPTIAPSSSPTITNPNDIIEEITELDVVKDYPNGMDQFDSVFYNAQLGGLLGPIFCALALVTGLMEYCCCLFKCSWLPTAIFLYLAFMFQMFTLFLFLSEDFCKYDQDCRLGAAGYGTALAVLIYFICQMLVCCTPRPQPLFNLFKPPPKRTKKKKRGEEGYDDGMYYDDDEYVDEFGHDDYDDPDYGYQDDPYADDGTYDQNGYDDDGTHGDDTQNTGRNGRPGSSRSRGMPPVSEDQSYYDDGQTEYDGQTTYDDRTDDNGTGTYDGQSFRTYDDNQSNDNRTFDDSQYDDGYTQSDNYDESQGESFESREID